MKIRVSGGADGLAVWLEDRPLVRKVILDGEVLLLIHEGTRESEVGLLKEMVLEGFPIAEYSRKDVSLEDVFLEVTKGRVQ